MTHYKYPIVMKISGDTALWTRPDRAGRSVMKSEPMTLNAEDRDA